MKNIIIFGSGRSGTSMLAGALGNSGYHFGDNSHYLGSNKANPKGFFEDLEVNTINEDILKLNLLNMPEKMRRSFFPSHTFYRARWLARISKNKTIRSNKSIGKRIKRVTSNSPYCFKDPRFSYTLPIWLEYLNNTNFLVIYRHPAKTADSILRECSENKALRKLKLKWSDATNVWLNMYEHILKNYENSNEKERWLFIHYDQVFQSEKIQLIEKFIGNKIDLEFPEKHISRTTITDDKLSVEILEIYRKLNELSLYKNSF